MTMMDMDDHCWSVINQFVGFENHKIYKNVLKELRRVQWGRKKKELEYIKKNRYIITKKLERRKYITIVFISRYDKKEKIREFMTCEVDAKDALCIAFGYHPLGDERRYRNPELIYE